MLNFHKDRLPLFLISIIFLLFIIVFKIYSSDKISVYTVEMTLSTTSDWTEVYFTNADVYCVKMASTSPTNLPKTTEVGYFSIHKEQYDKTPVEVKYIINIPTKPKLENIEITILKGDIGITSIVFKSPERMLTLASVKHDKKIEGDVRNRQVFYIPFSSIKVANKSKLEIPSRVSPKLVLAFYYPWYGSPDGEHKYWSHWNPDRERMTATDKPVLGYYDSYSTDVIRSHIEWAKEARIDGFIVSWWGIGSGEDIAMDYILKCAQDENFLIAIYYEPENNKEGILKDLRYIYNKYCNNSSFLKIDGRPVIFFYERSLKSLSSDEWLSVFEELSNENIKLISIADNLSGEFISAFDGIHTYNPSFWDLEGLELKYNMARTITMTWGKLFCATVISGYNDTYARKPGLSFPRDDGRLYEKIWDIAINSRPNMILITSFNEWHEGTEIEPSEEYGYRFIKLTKEFSDKFKK